MKTNQSTLYAAMLLGLASGLYRTPPSITSGNRIHRDRAPNGSPEHLARLAAAEAKRQRRAAKRVQA